MRRLKFRPDPVSLIAPSMTAAVHAQEAAAGSRIPAPDFAAGQTEARPAARI
jgi:hypothetical protein